MGPIIDALTGSGEDDPVDPAPEPEPTPDDTPIAVTPSPTPTESESPIDDGTTPTASASPEPTATPAPLITSTPAAGGSTTGGRTAQPGASSEAAPLLAPVEGTTLVFDPPAKDRIRASSDITRSLEIDGGPVLLALIGGFVLLALLASRMWRRAGARGDQPADATSSANVPR